jgi:chemotaxis protein histidine kinase CheA
LAQTLSEEEILRLLCLPGLSTRQDASETSGRGIGLDAVDASVRAVGGDLRIHSSLGRGTTVTVELPTTRRGEKVLVLSQDASVVALPSSGVKSYRRLTPDMLSGSADRPAVNLGGRVIPIQPLAELLGLPVKLSGTLVEVLIGGVAVVVLTDAVIGEEEVFLRPLPGAVGAPPVFDGAALLASGRPVPILSLMRLGRFAGAGAANP